MNNKPLTIKISIIFGSFIAIIILISLIWWFLNKDKTSTLEILVAPSSANILINNKKYTNGTYKIKPGNYTVNITKDNFNTYSSDIILSKNQTTQVYQGLKQSDGSNNWYLEHKEDDIILSAIGGKAADETQQNLASKNPILQYIPYTEDSNGVKYKIDAQITNNDLEYLIISFNTCSAQSIETYKTEALNWIKTKGIDPSIYNIKYSDLCS